jgi:hypothetical protein
MDGLDWIGCPGKRLANEGRHKAAARSREALRTFQRVRGGLFYWLRCAVRVWNDHRGGREGGREEGRQVGREGGSE